MTGPSKDFRVAIVGGGMCGLVCAIGLAKAGIHAEIFEQAPSFQEVGAGVGLGPNALFPLKELGVLEAVLSKANETKPTMRAMRFISATGPHDLIIDYPASSDDIGLGVYRNVLPSFLEAIVPMLDPRLIHMEHRCISISTLPSGSHALHFANGSTHEADLVIAADGIKSVLRDFVAGQSTSLVYSNSVAYRSVIPIEALKAVKTDIMRLLCWIGKNKHMITFPIHANQKINVVFFSTDATIPIGTVNIPPPWVKPASHDELLHECSGWGEDANIILNEMKDPSKWYLHFLHPPLSSYVRQKVVLVGDAAHAMLPHLGSGVGQGFEDVYALCCLLGDARSRRCRLDVNSLSQLGNELLFNDPQAALLAYDTIRVTRANMVQKMSTVMGDIVEGRGPDGGTIPQIQEQVKGIWHPIWHYDLQEDVKRALATAYGPNAVL